MAIYAIADLHLSFEQNKPMNIFGENWQNHSEKIKDNWLKKAKQEDTVVLAGDFSWAMSLKETKKDFEFINNLPGMKILLKGNHDYWWTTVTNIKKYLEKNNFKNIDFLYNNSFLVNNKILAGTRGWNFLESKDSKKMLNREINRLKLSIEDGISKYGKNREIIIFMHYPPIVQNSLKNHQFLEFIDIMKEYKIKRCFYGHLHGKSHQDAVEGNVEGIEFKLISADYLNFNLIKIS